MRTLRITNAQRRSFVSSLFALTFFGAVVTVSASTVLPCPARGNNRRSLAEPVRPDDQALDHDRVVVTKKTPRRWIEERLP
ncbi:hypothetical protein BOTBODRAFT_159131 [Botryobasidium botryosum FD-172 SS1]|uniref:Uncharacterized protein n=1 Tax=Botryobasidium botryosum (strain FD-172 SS1) TaxID=930990 RepID=A0A067MSY6_BOTB1|nr:hypothetical protein BOTBODRAFT_159131 [Botryobasidium botryosum FD-172 SS1]